MGLLDGLIGTDWNDPKSQATLSLAAGLLGPGGFGTGLSRGLAGYQGTMGADAETKLKRAQTSNVVQEAQLRDLQMQQMRQKLAFGAQFMDPSAQGSAPQGMSPASQAMGIGAQQGSIGPTVQNAQTMDALPQADQQGAPASRFAKLTPDQIAGALAAGLISKETADLWTHLNTGTPMAPGWRIIPGQAPTYLADPTKGVTMNGGQVTTMPGATDTLGALAGATKAGELRGANTQTPIPLDRLDRNPSLPPFGTMDDLLNLGRPVTGPMAQLSPAQRAAAIADMAARGQDPRTMRVNGMPVSPGSVATTPVGFKSPADLEAEKLQATQGVHAATDPLVKFNTDRLVNAHAQVQSVYDKLSDTVRSEFELQNRNQQLLPLLGKIQSGGFAPEERIQFANALKTSGMVPGFMQGKLADWVANGDPTAGKVIENQLAAAGVKTMLDTLDKEGKPNRAIFQAIQQAQESIKSGNGTLKQVFDLQKQLYDLHYQQEQDLASRIASPNYNPITTLADFSKTRNTALQKSPGSSSATLRFNPANGKLEPIN